MQMLSRIVFKTLVTDGAVKIRPILILLVQGICCYYAVLNDTGQKSGLDRCFVVMGLGSNQPNWKAAHVLNYMTILSLYLV